VERPFSYIRQDFFLARPFRNLDDLNGQLADWLATVANVRLHGTTQRIVSDAFAAEQPELQPLPVAPFDALLKLERRVSHDGLVSIGGNYYSVPDRTRRVVEVHQLPDAIRILDGGRLVARVPGRRGGRPLMTRSAPAATTIDSIRHSLVGLRMPRALEVLDATLRRIEQGEIDGIGALDEILVEELTLRENRRIKTALLMARLTAIKTLAGFDFAFQPSLDRNRILALAELKFIDRAEVVHLLGPPATGKSHLATALAVEAVKAGRSVVFSTLADLIASLAKAERDGTLRERIRYLC
jgi:hypothetical protein